LWFKNLNEADPYLLLPIIATVLNYINLGVSYSHLTSVAWNHKRERALVCKSIQIFLLGSLVLPFTIHTLMASRRIRLLDKFVYFCIDLVNYNKETLVFE
jgi:hypothetical protein